MPAPHHSDIVIVRPRRGGLPADLGPEAVPGSKSHAQRALLLAGLGAGTATIENVPDARDVEVMAQAVAALGARVERHGRAWRVRAAAVLQAAEIDCEDNGTALRTLLMAIALVGGRARLHGSARLQQRPLREALDALAGIGLSVDASWPLALDGTRSARPQRVVVEARDTSQVASGVVLGLACRAARGHGDGVAVIEPPLEGARGYVDLTCRVVAAFGHRVETATRDHHVLEITVRGARTPHDAVYSVPADASAATFVAALAAMHGRPTAPAGASDGHPDWGALEDLSRLTAAPPDSTVRIVDLYARPDTFPALCVVAAARPGRTELDGAPALRHKESDRIAAMADGLRALSVPCDELAGGLVVHGRDLREHDAKAPVAIPAPNDHRIVMALALLGTVVPAGVSIGPRTAPAKSWPEFFAWLGRVAEVR